MQQSIDISCPPGSQPAAGLLLLLLWTDVRQMHRPRSTYYAGRVGNFMCNYPRRSGPSVNTSVIQPIHIISLSVEAKQTDALLFADYRSERTCLSSSAVTADSNKCYGEFQRRLTSIASDRTRRRHPHAYVCLVSCVLAVFVSINIG